MKNAEDIYPLSPLQNGMLFHSLMAPASGVYVNQVTCTLPVDLDSWLFRQAWERLVERHGVLRTAFFWEGLDEPLQVVRKSFSLPWQELDWRGLPADEQQRRFEELRHRDRHTPLALGKAPLMRFSLIRLDRELGFIWTFHHLLLDGWSVPLLVQELGAVYTALQEGREPALPPVRPFGEYVVWLQKQDLLRAELFWRRELAGFAAPTPLGIDHPAGTGGASGYAEHTSLVSRGVTAGLQALATRHKLTLQTVTLGAWALLLSRYGGEEDVLFGGVVSGRPAALPGVETMVGMFINTLPVRVCAGGAEPLDVWLRRLQERLLALNEFEYSSLVQIQRWSDVPSGAPLFETIYVFENYPATEGGRGNLRIGNLRGFETNNYPVALMLRGGDQIHLRLMYDRSRIEDAAAPRLLNHLAALLASMAEGPERHLGELDLLTLEERSELLARGWGPSPASPGPDLIHLLVTEQALRTPDAIAVAAGSRQLTYAELVRRSLLLARTLRGLGVAPEVPVGVSMERSPEMVVALLAVLEAGGFYVPLDPSLPPDRLAVMVEDCQPAVVVTGASTSWALGGKVREIRLSADWGADLRGGTEDGALAPGPDTGNLAYVIYTSGSTGRPKGVQLPHRAVVNFLRAMAERPGLGSGDVVPALTTLSFDIAGLEIYLPLARGGRIEIVSREEAADGQRLARRIAEAGVTVMQATPATWRLLVDSGWPGRPGLKTLCGGEALPRELAEALISRGAELWNLYGPTETAIWSAAGRVAPGLGPVRLGQAIDHTRLYVVGRGCELAPPGVPGELWIAGDGVARGYLGRPDLTAERFVADPFSGNPGARLYRTGDLVRWREERELEFLGRLDHQVKVRGFRIELGEIEATLVQHPAVREVVVAAREDRPGGRRLVAYVVGDAAVEELRRLLRDRLPDYMVPAAFVMLAALPLTPNGKVDRKALPAPEWQGAEEGYLAPRSPVEEILAGIWAEVLGVERVGAADQFFDLGGHSLLATQVMSRLRGAFGVEMPLRDLFEAPRLAELAARVEAALRSGAGRLAPPLVPSLREGPLPLSFAQQRLWFIDQLEPGSPLYNIPVALRVEGPLDSAVLALCLGEIVRRHEALRTVFAVQEGSPVQVIQPAAPFVLPVVDLSGEDETTALSLAGEEAVRPFDLARGPLLRGVLLRLGEEDHIVALTMHHIVSDAWSMGVLIREVTALYAAFAKGRPSPLPELSVQYADFASWQRSWLQDEVLESEISFWRGQLAGLPPRLELPTDHPRPAVQSFRGGSRRVELSAGITRQMQTLGRREGATLFMVLLAGLQALLSRYSGQDDLAVGTPVAGRNRVEIEGLIGFFVNTLVLRGDLSDAPSFRELLGRVRETMLAAHAHQEVPFEKLVEDLAPERSLAQTPLFQVMFVLQNAPVASVEVENVRLRPVSRAGTTARFDLTLSLQEREGGLAGTVEHATDLFDPTTIRRLLAGFERLLAGAVTDPDLPLADIPLLSEAELHQLRSEWNPTSAAPGVSLVEMFESWADRMPDAVAVLAPEEVLTYAELDRRANRLAHRLRALGVGADSRAGLCAERSPAMIVAVLGILKAGAAYVPLDPSYPRERLAFMLEDARIPVLLTEERLLGSLPEFTATTVLLDGGDFEHGSARRLPGVTMPESLCYVIYTSGSTGRPKGVMISHRGWSNLADAQRRLFGVGPGDRVLQFASLSFDASASEIAMTFSAGAALVLGPRERRLSREELTALLRESTIATLPPTVLATLSPEDVPELKTLIVAGEACPPELARSWAVGRRFFNAYGPTEASVCATAKLYGGEERLTIGRSIEGVQTHVLDAWGNPVLVGVAGELYLGGPGLARGYLNLPGRTAQSFVPHPFATLPGERLYRTGDLVRRLPDGEIEFLGRLDHQVKIRGFRVEPGEIEAALVAHPGVRQAAVAVREIAGSKTLVAYIAGEEPPPTAAELRVLLRRQLPEHMIPAFFVVLARLSLTPNGKVDRKALPAPEQQGSEESYVSPRTPVEEVLAGIWAEVLGLARVGVADSFFDLGGHSLLAIQVMSRLRSTFGVEMPLRDLFAAPRLADLAVRVEAALRAGTPQIALPLAPVPREGPQPLSFAQQRLWFLDRLASGNPFYNIFSVVRLTGELDMDALRRAFQETVWRHEALRTVFQVSAGRPVQVIVPRVVVQLPAIDLEGLTEEFRQSELARLANAESLRPFDLDRYPLFRVQLVRLEEREHALLVNLHHIVSDGWSRGILFSEIAALYGAFSQGERSPLPELPIQYADFAIWQRQQLQGERLEAELDYWRHQLAGIPESLEFPVDHPRPAIESFRGSVQSFTLPVALVRALTALTRQCGTTRSMTMLAGFQALLARYTGREDIPVGVAIANRTRREVEGLIGFFVNTLVVRGDLAGSPGFASLLARVRETALAAYAHQDLPFERLVEELQPERDLSRNPLVQVMFGYQNFPRTRAEVRGLVLSTPDGTVTARTAKFDLTLFLFENGDRLTGLLEYNSELFEATTLRRLLSHFENLLAAAVAKPAIDIALLPLLSAEESHQLALEWNDTRAAYPAPASLPELFEAQVRSTPDATALLWGDRALSYRELNRHANRLAHGLRRLGVGPESRVGLCLERSPELIIGMVGILKAGGAYVPLDPDYPRERLAFMMEDSGLRVLVGDGPGVERLPGDLVARTGLILLAADPVEPADGPIASFDDDRPVAADGESLAYVIYTSGSTGRPKGVEIAHRAISRLVLGSDYVQLTPADRVAQAANASFDAITFEVWGPLLNGGCVVGIDKETALSPTGLGARLGETGVTTLFLTTALFNNIVRENPSAFGGLRHLLFGGEAVDPHRVREALAKAPPERLLHVYGPTESTTFATSHRVGGMPPGASTVPIGRPIANTRVLVLDPLHQPVPIGVVGELCIAGDGLARAYSGQASLTAQKLIPDPLAGITGQPGACLYRTGDLVRLAADGTIEFKGRIDHQVKVRGFRIELGEIEAHLGEHPAVLQSVVLAREDVPGDRRLVAYVLQNPAHGVLEDEAQSEQVSQWSEIFDDLYRADASEADPTFNIVGWDSSYTGLPLPRTEMEEWLEDTVGRILSLSPRRVLEIGCGTGMILFRVAPGCELYTGTDISSRALGYIESQLGRLDGARSRIQLLQRPAEQFEGMESGSFDTVVLNSVVQYFPSADYLAEVLERAVDVVRPGGSIFLGDLRSLPLLEVFDASMELVHAAPEMRLPHLRQKVLARRLHENELALAPSFFAALQQRLPKIARVEVHPKRGRAHNELTAFRYQVVLRIGERAEPKEIFWLDWRAEGLTLAALRRLLKEDEAEVLGLRNVPNARVAEDVAVARLLLAAEEGIETVGDLRQRAAGAEAGAVEPQDLWDFELDLPYQVELSWASPGNEGCFEAVLRRRGGADAISNLLPAPQAASAACPLSHYANNPLQGRFARRIAPELRAFLAERLPDYMVPSSFVLLDAFPLSPNGKVDRRRLPAPDQSWREADHPLMAPRNATEERLVEIWQELLGIERVGVDDDFFELGGHSLLATQAVSRVREAFGMELPLRTFFEASSVAAVAAEVDALRRGDGEAAAPSIVPRSPDGLLPLSFAQERLWFLHRLNSRTLAYNESAAFRMEGLLDAAALRWSLDEVLQRHEGLRTTFPEVDGQAVQTIHPPAPFEVPSVDLRALPSAVRDEEAERLARGQALHPFDLARGPLVRGLLVRLGERDHAILFSFHHIVFDGWSIGIFMRELSALYSARIAGRPSPLAPLAIQYADFAAWQRQWLRGEILERQLAWWRERLTGVAALGLATDRPRPVFPQAVSSQRALVIPPALTQELRALSLGRGTTLFMTLLAAFQALLHRSTGQDDIAVGTPIANRTRGEVEPLIGFFVNMLVLRTSLAGDPSFGDLLERVRQTALGAYAHQDLPFEKLVEELRPVRSLRHAPLFQVSFQLLNVPASALDLPGLVLHPLPFTVRSTKFDLNLGLTDRGEQLSGLLDYDTDLFDGTTAERLLAHLSRLLTGAVESPEARLSELPLLTPAEHSQVVVEWNDTQADLAAETRLQDLFEAQVRLTPAAVALRYEGEELRYGELNTRANRLAHLLRRWGVEPGVLVGLCLERSLEMVIGILGVLKAGGAYIPLDPSYPRDRLAFMVADAGVPVLLTQEHLRTTILPAILATTGPEEVAAGAPRVVCLDALSEEMDGESAEDPSFPGGADELAYVIYTSGSTGRPKGAMNGHRAICNRLLWMQAADGLTADDRVLQKTPFSFDVSVWELFWPLTTGARLVLARPGGHQDPSYLVQLIAREGITTAHFVPSLLQVFLETQDIGVCTSLRRVVCSGEALSAPLARRFFASFPDGAAPILYNLYGPTEAAVEVTAWRCVPESPLAAVPIGRPVANTVAYVLDDYLRAVPIGIPGELYLGGVQLARGYHARPDLTAERFIPDPFAQGARLYRTGDQVRRLAGGEIVYLGRLDHQVKIRGVRIELGEIESVLSTLAGVSQAVVLVREDTSGDPRLVAYVTGEPTEEELHRQLRERLPEALVPTIFVHVEALPLLPNGKVDRKALPAPDRSPAPSFVAPRTPSESLLAEIWAELLGVERIGVQDHFFERGGHSLLAVLLMARIENRFGKALPLATLFASPTLESLAARLTQAGSPGLGQRRLPLVAIQPQGDRVPFFCVHPVGGNVLCYLDLASQLGPQQPFYALQTPDSGEGPGAPALPSSIEQMAALYVKELRQVQPRGPYRLGGWSMGGLVAFEMARQLAREGDEPDLVALIDTLPPAPEPLRPPSEEELVASFAQDLARLLGHDVGISPEELRPLATREKLGHVVQLGHAAGLLQEDFGLARIEPLFATFAANLRASWSYAPEPYPGSVTLWLSEQTLSAFSSEPGKGWSRLALGGIETRTLPGDHYSLLRLPQVERLAHELTARLAVAGDSKRLIEVTR
jgi:amino acid adenylation domain-containing protein